MSTPTHLIRNFSIIAHIDHGKSTLADRLLDATDALTSRERRAQFMDSMDLERERGITINAATVRLTYAADDGETYELNLIDTPGHVDFHYEVSRSLAACEGAVLVVDASQGVEAQTLANVYLAVNLNLTIVPVINKIDLPAADPENARKEIEEVVGIDASEAVLASAKEGIGIHEILEQIVKKVPPPVGDAEAPLKVLLLDSWYDTYRGVVILVRVIDGVMKPKQKVLFMAVRREYELQTVGAFAPFAREVPELTPGEVGFFTAAIKEVGDARVGETITELARPCAEPLAGFKPA
ncbi:MAG TPA: GTP-binding protein, partial [Polyangia bacterium]|nr:GTP-binding protein [Polyangia bacterium]